MRREAAWGCPAPPGTPTGDAPGYTRNFGNTAKKIGLEHRDDSNAPGYTRNFGNTAKKIGLEHRDDSNDGIMPGNASNADPALSHE